MADMKFWKLYDFRTTLYSGVFGVADYEFQINVKFLIRDPKSPEVQSSMKIVGFPKYDVRHFEFRKYDVKFQISDPKSF